MSAMLQVENVSVSYGKVEAVRAVTLEVREREIEPLLRRRAIPSSPSAPRSSAAIGCCWSAAPVRRRWESTPCRADGSNSARASNRR